MTYTTRETYDFISKQTNDPIVEWKTCKISNQPFPIYQSDLDFYDKISPTFNRKKYQIPTPTLCPEERLRRRLAFRNERKMYYNTSAHSGQDLITIYSPDKPYKVYEQDFRWSDGRNPMDYGRDFDFSKTFYENIASLWIDVPTMNLMNMANDNAQYTNYTMTSKNIYMSNDVQECENIFYSNIIKTCKDCSDITNCINCSLCYECVRCENSHLCFSCYACKNSNSSMYLHNCIGMNNSLFCVEQQGKTNYLFNKPSTKEEIESIRQKILNGKGKEYINQYQILLQQQIVPAMENIGSQGCFGNLLTDSKNAVFCFDTFDVQDCKYGLVDDKNTDCRDVTICNPNCHLSYECISAGEAKKSAWNVACGHASQSVYYSYGCMFSENLFACAGLRYKEYCILNKQYTKEEYEKTVAQIIEKMQESGERGEFFHPSLSPFGYNETIAQEYLPLEKVDLPTQHGYKRSDYSSDPKIPENAELLSPLKLTDEERKALVNDDTITQKVIICKDSGRPFTIQKLELEFYRKMGLSIPKQHPDIRHEARMKQRPERTLHLRTCDKCKKEIVSVYPAEETRTVYCEECYRQEVYG